MSVENFFLIHPVSENLKSIMIKEKLPDMSPIATFAARLAGDAGNGLREITKKLNHADLAFRLDRKNLEKLPEADRERALINLAGVIFGVSVPALEDCMIKGSFDLGLWCSLYNAAISGTQFSTMQPEEGQSIETLSKEHLQKMRDLVREDKTFAVFFEDGDGVESTPNSLIGILSDSGTLPVIRKDILPSYKERAKILVV